MRWFFNLRRPTLRGFTSAYAVGLGALMLYGGVGHTIAVTAVHVRAQRAYDFRFAALLAIGAVLIYGAVTNLVLARWIGRGHRWAMAWSIATTAAIVLYTSLLLPLEAARDAAGPAFVLNAAYLIFAFVALGASRDSNAGAGTGYRR